MIYTLYIYNRHGSCIYYQDWGRQVQPADWFRKRDTIWILTCSQAIHQNRFADAVNLFHIPPPHSHHVLRENEKAGFHFYKTTAYKLHFFETATNYKFVLTTDPDVPDLRDHLKSIYKNVFVEYITKNPLIDPDQDTPIHCELFNEKLNTEIKTISTLKSKDK